MAYLLTYQCLIYILHSPLSSSYISPGPWGFYDVLLIIVKALSLSLLTFKQPRANARIRRIDRDAAANRSTAKHQKGVSANSHDRIRLHRIFALFIGADCRLADRAEDLPTGKEGAEGVREREFHHLDTYVGSGHLYIIILD